MINLQQIVPTVTPDQALDVAQNKEKCTNFAYTQKVWNHKKIAIDDVFVFAVATDLLNDDIEP